MEINQDGTFKPITLTLQTAAEAKALFKVCRSYLENREESRRNDGDVIELCLCVGLFGDNHVQY